MRHLRPVNKVFIPLFVIAVVMLATHISQRDRPEKADKPHAGTKAAFDFYLLALTSHAAFCIENSGKSECRADSPPLSLHGLWPERLEPGRYPHDCPGPALDLDAGSQRALATVMPGMADGLHEHEWRKHGTCTGLDDDGYFMLAYARAREVERAIGDKLTTIAGQNTTAAALRAYADEHEPGMGATLTFHCRTPRDAPLEHRGEPYLMEIRRCFDDLGRDGAPGNAVSCASVNRRDQGCGSGFRIAP